MAKFKIDILAANMMGSITRLRNLLQELDGKYQFTSGEVKMLERALDASYGIAERIEERTFEGR